MIKEEIKKVFKSKVFQVIIYILGFVVIASFIFKAGMYAGLEKASFGKNWGDNYTKNFGMQLRGPRMFMEDFDNFPNPHGAIGKIIKNNGDSIVVLDGKDRTEKIVIINNKTQIRQAKFDVKKEDLTPDSFVVVIGQPNKDGQIEARLIRVVPSPEIMEDLQINPIR